MESHASLEPTIESFDIVLEVLHHRVRPILLELGLLDVPSGFSTGLVRLRTCDIMVDKYTTLQVLLVLLRHHGNIIDRLLVNDFLRL